MKPFYFKDGTGQTYEVQVDDNVDEAEARRRFDATLAKQRATPKQASNAELGQMAIEERPTGARNYTREHQPSLGEEFTRWGKLAGANVGAGWENSVEGMKEILPGFKGMTDEQIRNKRELDRELADSVTGGKGMQVLGELLPTLGIPAGGFVRGTMWAAPKIANMLRTAFGAATKIAPAAQVARAGTQAAITDAALAGGTAGALQPVTSQESRPLNTALGATVASVPIAGVSGVQWLHKMLSAGGAEQRAAEELVARLGPQAAADAIAKIRAFGFGPVQTRDIPTTPAQITQDPALAAAQRASMANAENLGQWAPYRAKVAQERWNALQKMTPEGTPAAITALEDARDAAALPTMRRALDVAGQDKFFTEPVVAKLSALERGGSRPNPGVQDMIRYVRGELDKGMTPEQLYTVRDTLTKRLNGPTDPSDQLAASLKKARRETMGMVETIDAALNKSSGGKWQRYLDKYADRSGPVDSARAQQELREMFTSDSAPTVAGVPELTAFRVGRGLEKSEGKFGQLLDENTLANLRALRDHIKSDEDLQKLITGTATGGRPGSNTALDRQFDDAARDKLARAVPGFRALVERADNFTRRALVDALQHPDVFVRGVQRKLDQGLKLKPGEEAVLRMVRSVAVAPGAALTAQ